jgi:hypothetical protein
MTLQLDGIAEGFEQLPNELSPWPRNRAVGSFASSGMAVSASSGRSLLLPARALPKTSAMATLRNEDARVWAIVHVLLELTTFTRRSPAPTHEADWIHFDEQGSCAPLFCCFG